MSPDCEEGVRPRGYRFRGGGDDASVRRDELSLGNRVCVFLLQSKWIVLSL